MDHKTNAGDLLAVMLNFWKMEPPKLIISVTGGAKRFFMKNRLKDSFNRGLINAATSTGQSILHQPYNPNVATHAWQFISYGQCDLEVSLTLLLV